MKINSPNIYPVIVVPPSSGKALQKETPANLPSQHSTVHVSVENRMEFGAETFWKKGTFVDLYV